MECPFALGIMWQCSGKPSHFALKTIINRFLNERHNPLLKVHKANHKGLLFCFLELGLRDCAATMRNTACNTAFSLLSDAVQKRTLSWSVLFFLVDIVIY